VRATPVFIAALFSETLVIVLWRATPIGFLWFNLTGCAAVMRCRSLNAVQPASTRTR
jgi:hypothetical protein